MRLTKLTTKTNSTRATEFVCLAVKDIAIGAGGHGLDSRAGQIGLSVQQRLAATFLRGYIAETLSRGDGSRRS